MLMRTVLPAESGVSSTRTCTRRTERELAAAMKAFEYQAHYLNILELIGNQLAVPEVKIVSATLQSPPIDVDLVLDVGNTHTCRILPR